MSSPDAAPDVPVLIVGAGPTGLAAAIALSRAGVRSLVADRRDGPSPYPRSTGVSARTMQILRRWGIDGAVRDGAIPVPAHVYLAASLGAPPLQGPLSFGVVESPEADAHSPVPGILAPQDHLEPALLELAARTGMVDVSYATEVRALEDDGAQVAATLRPADGAERRVTAAYAIAADGAHSRVREQLGIGVYGPGHVATYRSMLFRSPDLHTHVGEHGGALHILAGPPYPGGGFIRQGADRWVFWYPIPDGEREVFPDARCAEIVREGAGIADLTVELERSICFDLAIHVTERFRSGRIFIAGDAAHRMTPIGAMGANTAIHDVVNLAWKLAGVLAGWAGEALLDSYELERRPVAERNAMRSLDIDHFLAHEDLSIDLGYVAVSDAIAFEGDEPDPAPLGRPYAPSGAPGRLAPHAWVEVDGVRRSTVDFGDDAFTLLCTDPGWRTVATAAAKERGVPLRVVLAAPGREDADLLGERFGIGAAGAALIRPDGIVAWRTTVAALARAEQFGAALERAVGAAPSGAPRAWNEAVHARGEAMQRQAAAAREGVSVVYI